MTETRLYQAKLLFNEYWDRQVNVRHKDIFMGKVEPEALRKLLQASIQSLMTRCPKGMILLGKVGVGKTSCLNLVWREHAKRVAMQHPNSLDMQYIGQTWMNRNVGVKFLSHSELIKLLRLKEEGEGILTLINLNDYILMIDDFGVGFADKSGWNLSLQEEFFDLRWRNNLPTYITTNYTPKQLRALSGWERIVDRIADPNWMVQYSIGGASKRTKEFQSNSISGSEKK